MYMFYFSLTTNRRLKHGASLREYLFIVISEFLVRYSAMNGARKQRGSLTKNGKKKDTFTQNQKETDAFYFDDMEEECFRGCDIIDSKKDRRRKRATYLKWDKHC